MKRINSSPLLLSLLWLVLIIVVNPIGDFPLNDDWAYASSAKILAEENRLTFDDWGAMTLVVQTVWGALFCKVFGFSYTVLRFSTLVLGWLGMLGCFYCFKESGKSNQVAFWGTLLVIFNPFYFCLSYSFMTDIPFLAFLLWSTCFFIKTINNKGNYNIILATIFSILATLIRQPGVLLPLAFFLIYLLKNKFELRSFFLGIIPFIATFASLQSFVYWRKIHDGLSDNFGKTDQLINNFLSGNFLKNIEEHAHSFFMYWGLFMIPLLLVLLSVFWKKTTHLQKGFSLVITLLLSFPFFEIWHTTLLGNVFYNLGMGPDALPTTSRTHPIHIGGNDWENILLTGFIFGMVLLNFLILRTFQAFDFLKNKTFEIANWASVFALIFVSGYFVFLLLGTFFIDRYTLTLFPFLVLLLLPQKLTLPIPIFIKILSGVCLFVLFGFSITATHDLLACNRARWKTIDHALNEMKILPNQLDGGFEYNYSKKSGARSHIQQGEMDWWTEENEKYILSHSRSCGYEVKAAFPYFRFLLPRTDSVFLLKVKQPKLLKEIFCDAENLTEDGQFYVTSDSTVLLKNLKNFNSQKSLSGKNAVQLSGENQYAFNQTITNIQPCDKIWTTVWRYPEKSAGAIFFEGNENYHLIKVESANIKEKNENGWGQLHLHFTVPVDFKGSTLDFYLYNPSENKVWLDDLKITIVRF